MVKLKLNLLKEEYFLSKRVFDYPDLTITEIRLLLVLSSKPNLTIDKLNYNNKLWICNNKKSQVKKFPEYIENFIRNGLLDEYGKGLDLKKDFLVFRNIKIFEDIKSIKQLLLHSVDIWDTRGECIIGADRFTMLFGDTIKRQNYNFKRVAESTGLNIKFENKNNKFYLKHEIKW